MASKSSEQHFTERQIALENSVMASSDEMLEKLKSTYKACIDEQQRKIEAFYARYAREGKVSREEARKLLNDTEMAELKRQADVYIKEITELGHPEYTKQLENITRKSRIKRMEALNSMLVAENDLLYSKYDNATHEQLSIVYEDSYYKTSYNIQNYVGLGTPIPRVTNKMLENILKYENSGLNFSERIWNDRDNVSRYIVNRIAQGFAAELNPAQITKDIEHKYNVSASNAKRLVRTETNFFLNQATADSYSKNEIDEYEYLATLDNKTSEICQDLDNLKFPVSEAQAGVNYPPMHPNCRSTTIPVIERDEFDEPETRAARDSNGKTYKIEKMSYKEWKEKYVI